MSPSHKRIVAMIVVTAVSLAAERWISGSGADSDAGSAAGEGNADAIVMAVKHGGRSAAAPESRADSSGSRGSRGSRGSTGSIDSTHGPVQLDRLAMRKSDAAELSLSAAADAATDPAADDIQPLFGSKSWQPPPPPPPPAAPPPTPHAPPFPYVYMGGLNDNGQRINFFTQGERVLALKPGDTVDAAYRIETISATRMTMTYLPLNESMTLALGPR